MKKSSDANASSKESTTGSSSQAQSSFKLQDSPPSLSLNSGVATDDKLPEKYEILDNFFGRLHSLVTLYRLKRWTPTFTAISSGIESLTNMSFTHTHLAQLKYILADAMILKKHIVHDKRTSCMKEDILIVLDRDAVEDDSLDADAVEADDAQLLPQRGRLSLQKVFRARLRDFCKSHPKGDEVPEGPLPEPFNGPKKDMLETRLPTKLPRRMRYIDIVNNAESAKVDEE